MITEILETLTKLLGPIATLSKDQRERKDTALRTISNALDETFLYYRDLANLNERNLDREELLSKYWSAAAISLRHFDQDLALICDHKSEYWINPERYSDQDIQDLNIQLDNVRSAYRKMLSPKSRLTPIGRN